MQIIDARGYSCPEPAMMAAQAFDAFPAETVRVLVSSSTSKVNVSEVARRKGREVKVEPEGDDFAIVADPAKTI